MPRGGDLCPRLRAPGVCGILCLNWMLWGAFTPKVSKDSYPQEPSVLTYTPTCASWFLWHFGELSSLKQHALAPLPLSPSLSAAIQNPVPYRLSSLTILGPLGTRRACNPAAGQARRCCSHIPKFPACGLHCYNCAGSHFLS